MSVFALVVEPIGTLFDNITNPVKRFDIIDQSRTVKDAFFSDKGWAVTRQAAFALDRLDHG